MSVRATRSRLSQVLKVLSGVAIAVHLFGLYRPTGPPTPSWFPNADKLEHVLGFAAPVLLLLLARTQWQPAGAQRPTQRYALVVVGAFALHAVVSELIQHFFYTHRTGDPTDVLADWSGVALGVALAWLITRRHPRGTTGSSR